ncbi:hypothetical protein HanIR_Chr12g0587531 [Helianthus annuus]|nr:hypothetical protein HanIR_Chr12g0587531 [Helianthus annuus]
MGVRPLEPGEQYWYERIKGNFLYPPAGSFANPPTATEDAQLPNPRPLRAVTSAGKEILYLSSEESVGSSNGELSSWSNIFAGVLRDLGIDPKEKKKKPPKKKKVITIDAEVTSKKGGSSRAPAGASDKGTLRFRQSNLEDYVITSDSLEGLSRIGEKKTGAAGSKISGSASSRNPDAGATPSSIALEEEEEPAVKLISRKRSREETTAGASVAQKTGEAPLLQRPGKKVPEKKGVEFKDPQESAQKRTRVVIKPFKSAGLEAEKEKKKAAEKPVDKEKEKEKEKVAEKPEGDKSKETGAAATTSHEKAQGPEVIHITGFHQPLHEKKKETGRVKGPEVVKPTEPAQVDAPTQTVQVTSTTGGSAVAAHKETSAAAGGASSGGAGGFMPQTPIGPKDIVCDIYYKTYTEEARGDASHRAPWGLKQKDTFLEFAPCRDWFLNSFCNTPCFPKSKSKSSVDCYWN